MKKFNFIIVSDERRKVLEVRESYLQISENSVNLVLDYDYRFLVDPMFFFDPIMPQSEVVEEFEDGTNFTEDILEELEKDVEELETWVGEKSFFKGSIKETTAFGVNRSGKWEYILALNGGELCSIAFESMDLAKEVKSEIDKWLNT